MRTLRRKLFRDLVASAGTLLSVVAIITIGTSSFLGLGSAQRILAFSQDSYYREFRFADFWVDLKKAPLSAVERVAALPQVAAVEARIVFYVLLDMPGDVRPLTGRLISTPARGFGKTINGVCLLRGSGFSDDRDEEVIVSDAFAKAHGLDVGDRISLILNRKRQSFWIVGTAISPEFVYMVRGPGDLIPDPQHFGVLYVKDTLARDALDFKGSCNQFVGRLKAIDENDVDFLLDRIDRMLSPYGVVQTVPRRRQASHRILSDEIKGLKVSAKIMPGIFLAVAAMVLNIVMVRLAQRQRTTIGTLKALGCSNRLIMGHYLSYGVVVGAIGGVAGAVMGLALARGMIGMYKEFFAFPRFLFRLYPDLMATGVLISVGFAGLGSLRGVWLVLRLQPAEAMRPKPPERGGAVLLERWGRLWRSLGFRTQMALRSVLRNRTRTATTALASALAGAIMFMAMASYDSFIYLVEYQFEKVVHSEMDIALRDEQSAQVLFESRRLPGVDRAEPLLGVVCDLRHGRRSRRMAITGLTLGHTLITPMQADGTQISVPPDGLVMSRKLTEILGVRAGDWLDLTPVRGRCHTRRVRVAEVVDSFLGLDCYADLGYLSRIVGESISIKSVQLSVNAAERPELFRAIKRLPNTQGLSVPADSKQIVEKTLVETSLISIGMLVVFAGVIAFGSILNNALIEIGDRLREISTLRVIGYRPGQIAGILFQQNIVIFAAGMLVAFPLGYALLWALASAYDSELYRMPVVVRPPVVFYTATLALLFVLIAQWIVHRQVKRLDWRDGVQVKE